MAKQSKRSPNSPPPEHEKDAIIEHHMLAMMAELRIRGWDPIGVAGGVVFTMQEITEGSPSHVFFVMDGNEPPVVFDQHGVRRPWNGPAFVADVAQAMTNNQEDWRTGRIEDP